MIERLSHVCGSEIPIRANILPGAPAVVLSSGYGIFDYDEPVQGSLTNLLDELGIGWVQYIHPERTSNASTTDLLISGGVFTLSRVVDWMRRCSVGKIGLFGISFGANISVELAPLLRDVDLVIVINLVFDYVEYRAVQLGAEKVEEWQRNRVIGMDYGDKKAQSYYRFMEEASRQDVIELLAGITCPIHAFQAAEDSIIPTSYVKEAARRYRNVTPYVVLDADHVFTDSSSIERFVQRITPVLATWKDS